MMTVRFGGNKRSHEHNYTTTSVSFKNSLIPEEGNLV